MASFRETIQKVRQHTPKEAARKVLRRAFGENYYSAQSVRIIREHDARWPTTPVNDDKDLVSLHRDGFVKLGNLGIDVNRLSSRSESAFDQVPQDRPDLNHVTINDPFLFDGTTLRILANQRVNSIVRSYLGDDATFDFAELFRSPACSETVRISGLWHHDRVGHRLLLWVLLNDLDERGRATIYATGSHHRELEANTFASTRLADDFVDRNYPVRARMTGKRGDCILTDTHGIHRAVYERGMLHRDVLMVAYSSYAKSQALASSPLDFPIGPHYARFPKHFDPAGTLVRRERLKTVGGGFEYVGNPGRDKPRVSTLYDGYVDAEVDPEYATRTATRATESRAQSVAPS